MAEEKDKGFSYESPEKKKKSAVKVITIEIGAIIIIAIFIIGLLMYLRVIPVPTQIGNFIPSAFQSEHDIEVRSDVAGYSLELDEEKRLIELFKSWGVFDREYEGSFTVEGGTNGVPVKKVIIKLTDQQQKANFFVNSIDEVYSSSVFTASPGEITAIIHLSEDKLNDSDGGNYLRTNLFSSFNNLLKFSESSAELGTVKEAFYESFKTNPLMTVEYFTIKKKN